LRKPRRSPWFHSALFAVCFAAAAQAQSAGPPENPEADRFVTEGIALRAQGRDADALTAFQKAAAIDPNSVRVQIHLATVYQALGDWLKADEYLSMALARSNHPYVNRHRQVLEDAKKVIDANIGRLEVEGEPPGSEVRLNGRLVGTLPLASPVRVTIGSYVLEVQSPGHYPVSRPIVITGGGLVRERVDLEPTSAAARASGAAFAPGSHRSEAGVDRPAENRWLTWTLGGAAGVAGVVTIGAILYREAHAHRWNDDARCLEAGRTRADVCGSERDKAETGGTVAWVSGVTAGLFATGAVLNALGVFSPEPGPIEAGLEGCGVGLRGASCFGTF
jgi:tetratricopeptide repeat protein/PEGA domain-containing protein